MKTLTPAEIYALLPERLNTLAEARGFTVGFELCQEMARSEPYEDRKAEFCASCASPARADALGAQVRAKDARIAELEAAVVAAEERGARNILSWMGDGLDTATGVCLEGSNPYTVMDISRCRLCYDDAVEADKTEVFQHWLAASAAKEGGNG